jgi:hypothetical protein
MTERLLATFFSRSAVGFLLSPGYMLLISSILQDLNGRSKTTRTILGLYTTYLSLLALFGSASFFCRVHFKMLGSGWRTIFRCQFLIIVLNNFRTVIDFDDWTNWLFHKGGIGDEGKKSWEVWWDEEQAHIQTFRGRLWEILLSTRFFIFQYGVVYALHAAGNNKSFAVSTHNTLLLEAYFQ